MLNVQVKTRLPENCAFGTITEIMATMKLEGLTSMGNSVKGLLRVKAEKVGEILKSLPSYCEGVTLSSKEAKILIREHTCLVALPILQSGCIITDIEIRGREVVWNIVCDEDSFLKMMKTLERDGVDFEIVYKGRVNDKSGVTYREEEILKIALEKGYFDFPRRVKLEELAKHFGVAPSTLSEILRRGLKKILEKYFSG